MNCTFYSVLSGTENFSFVYNLSLIFYVYRALHVISDGWLSTFCNRSVLLDFFSKKIRMFLFFLKLIL